MKNKKKWASILTIATSLVLCIISTFGITLAFFGGNASANLSTITLKTGIEIGAAIESSVGSAKVVPGQPVKITATGTVSATDKGNPTEANAVDGVVRAKFNVGNELGTVTIAGNTTDYWTAGGDGYYYLVTAENGTTLRTVSKGTSVQIFGDLIVSKNFTNADSGKSVEASVIFEVIQADIYKTDGTKETLTVTNATTSTSPLYSAFDAVKFFEGYNVTLHVEYGYRYVDSTALTDVTTHIEWASLVVDEEEAIIIDGDEGVLNFTASSFTLGAAGDWDEELCNMIENRGFYNTGNSGIFLYDNAEKKEYLGVVHVDKGEAHIVGDDGTSYTVNLTQDSEYWLLLSSVWID